MANEKYKFNEKEQDIETGFLYYGARYYDGILGIWHQTDPLSFLHPNMSPYNYCMNNPLRFRDLWGLDTNDTGDNAGSPHTEGKSEDYLKCELPSLYVYGTRINLHEPVKSIEIVNFIDDTNTGVDAISTLGFMTLEGKNYWMGENGKYYSKNWQGNRYTGSRNALSNGNKILKGVGEFTLLLDYGVSIARIIDGMTTDNYNQVGSTIIEAAVSTGGYMLPPLTVPTLLWNGIRLLSESSGTISTSSNSRYPAQDATKVNISH